MHLLIRTMIIPAGALAAISLAPPALAGTNVYAPHYEHGNPSCYQNLRNGGQFYHSNDTVQSIDNCADGWGSKIEATIVVTGNTKFCYNIKGSGTSTTCDYNFVEGRVGMLRAWSVDSDIEKGAGDWYAFLT